MDISLNVLSLLKVISRISYYRLTEHRNANVARNYGILYTREEVINHYRKAVTHYEYLLPSFLTAPEAKEYGIVDEVLEHRS